MQPLEPVQAEPIKRRLFRWGGLVSWIAVTVAAALIGAAVTSLSAPKLHVGSSVRLRTSFVQMSIGSESVASMLRVKFCVTNRGLRGGVIARAVPSGAGLGFYPVVSTHRVNQESPAYWWLGRRQVTVDLELREETMKFDGRAFMNLALYDQLGTFVQNLPVSVGLPEEMRAAIKDVQTTPGIAKAAVTVDLESDICR